MSDPADRHGAGSFRVEVETTEPFTGAVAGSRLVRPFAGYLEFLAVVREVMRDLDRPSGDPSRLLSTSHELAGEFDARRDAQLGEDVLEV